MEIPVLRLLLETAPVGWTVSFVPGGWRVDEHNFCDPDIKVASGDRFKGEALLRVPQLAVDFRSGTRPAREFALKRQAYAHAGLAHYWVIDSDVPSITVFELIDGELVEHAVIGGASVVTIDRPFPARICPDELADGCVIVVPRDEEEA